MIHGTLKLELTYESVLEAINDYLQKHMLEGIAVEVTKWDKATSYGGATPSLAVEFKQSKPEPPVRLVPRDAVGIALPAEARPEPL